jgi:hypothetical protein
MPRQTNQSHNGGSGSRRNNYDLQRLEIRMRKKRARAHGPARAVFNWKKDSSIHSMHSPRPPPDHVGSLRSLNSQFTENTSLTSKTSISKTGFSTLLSSNGGSTQVISARSIYDNDVSYKNDGAVISSESSFKLPPSMVPPNMQVSSSQTTHFLNITSLCINQKEAQ